MGYTIGQFAGMLQVSKKTLRYYRDIGLLEPAVIDPDNGYAFYEDGQRERMKHIQYLRRLRFSLEDIRMLLDAEPGLWTGSVQAASDSSTIGGTPPIRHRAGTSRSPNKNQQRKGAV